MKSEEKLAKIYLESLGGYKILYEPDGNIPPDFSLNNDIGVEVRRLNQHFQIDSTNVPIEKLEYKLIPKIIEILKEIKKENFEKSINVSIKYGRPLKVDNKLINTIKNKLIENINKLENEDNLIINKNLQFRLSFSSIKNQDYISLGSITDLNTGGLVHQILYNNLKISLSEKENKIIPYLDRYRKWWLLLIDHIGFFLHDYDFQLVNRMPRIETLFDKIVIVSYLNLRNSHEILTKKACA